ncbi:MAG: DoxX family protein [Planctomycetota bacterium]
MKQTKGLTIVGWVVSALVSGMLIMSGVMKLSGAEQVFEEFDRLGFPRSTATPIGIAELACVALLLFPKTSVVGAILTVGYLGGATAVHVRLEEAFIMPVVIGVAAWIGIFLRSPAVRRAVLKPGGSVA